MCRESAEEEDPVIEARRIGQRLAAMSAELNAYAQRLLAAVSDEEQQEGQGG